MGKNRKARSAVVQQRWDHRCSPGTVGCQMMDYMVDPDKEQSYLNPPLFILLARVTNEE